MSHPVSGKVVRLTDWAVRVPSPQLGCLSVSPSFLLPLSFLPPSHLPITLLQWWPAGQGIFFLHLPYLARCIGRPSPRIKSTHCSITVATVPDGSAVQVCLPCARAKEVACDRVREKMAEMAVSDTRVLALPSSIKPFLSSVCYEIHRYCGWSMKRELLFSRTEQREAGSWMGWLCVTVCVGRVHTNCFHTHAFTRTVVTINRKKDFQQQPSVCPHSPPQSVPYCGKLEKYDIYIIMFHISFSCV